MSGRQTRKDPHELILIDQPDSDIAIGKDTQSVQNGEQIPFDLAINLHGDVLIKNRQLRIRLTEQPIVGQRRELLENWQFATSTVAG
jgi:hypothetical protein